VVVRFNARENVDEKMVDIYIERKREREREKEREREREKTHVSGTYG